MKTKKLFMSLGTVAAVTAPLVSAVSCGTMLSNDTFIGSKIGWDDSKRTIYLNLFNQNKSVQKGNLEPFMKINGTNLGGGFPTLDIAQKWEQVAGYSVDQLGKVDNLQNAKRINDGEIVHVVMAAQHFVWRAADKLHSTKWRDQEGYYLKWSFPFHTLEDTPLHTNAESDVKLLEYYQANKPLNIHTNFWKALNIIFAYKLGKGKSLTGISGTAPTLSTGSVFKEIQTTNSNPNASEFGLSTWKHSIDSDGGTIERLEAVYEKYHGKEIELTDQDVLTIYDDNITTH